MNSDDNNVLKNEFFKVLGSMSQKEMLSTINWRLSHMPTNNEKLFLMAYIANFNERETHELLKKMFPTVFN